MSEQEPDRPEPIQLNLDEDDEPIEIVGEDEAPSQSQKVRAFGSAAQGLGAAKVQYTRKPNVTGEGAVRCRLFHSRIAEAPLEHLEEQINTWLDHEEIEVKEVGHVVGEMVGKTREQNLIVLVWY